MFGRRSQFASILPIVAVLVSSTHGAGHAQTSIMLSGGFTRASLDVTCGRELVEVPFLTCDLLSALFGTATGAHVGIDVTRDLSPHFGMRLGIGFHQKGWMTGSDEGRSGQDMDYVDFGVLAKVSPVPQTGLFSVYGLAGPYLGFLVNCTEWAIDEASVACGEGIFGEVGSTDAGLVLGAGIAATRGRTNFVLEWLHGLGLANLWSEPLEGLDAARTRGFAVRAGIEYRVR